MSEEQVPKQGRLGQHRPFATFWNGRPLGIIEKLSLGSFVTRGYHVQLYSFDSIEVPDGVQLMDAAEILPRNQLFPNPRERRSFAGFSNIFRYAILKKKKVIWTDADVLCWNWNLGSRDYIFGWQDAGSVINGAVLAAPQNSTLLHNLIGEASTVNTERLRWGQLGPFLITNEVRKLGMEHIALPRISLYPIPPHQIWRVMAPSQTASLEEELVDSSALHLWHSVMSSAAPELDHALPPKGSLLANLAERYGGPGLSRSHLPAEWGESIVRQRLERFNRIGPRIRRRLSNMLTPRASG